MNNDDSAERLGEKQVGFKFTKVGDTHQCFDEVQIKILEMLYRLDQLEAQTIILRQVEAKIEQNEKDHVKSTAKSVSAIEAFKLETENFKERMREFELESENSARTAVFIKSNLELYQDNNIEFKRRLELEI